MTRETAFELMKIAFEDRGFRAAVRALDSDYTDFREHAGGAQWFCRFLGKWEKALWEWSR